MLMLAELEAVSRSWSVIVSVRVSVIRSADDSVTTSSGLVASGCCSARTWSSVTTPAALTLTRKSIVPAGSAAPPAPTRPTTSAPSMNRKTCWPVATSISPESTPALLIPSTKAELIVPAPSAPKLLVAVKLSAKFADALIARLVSSTTSASAGAVAVSVMFGPSSWNDSAVAMLMLAELEAAS
ncbi:hypothetical protein CI41S_48470 [Bradyrhizobium ivorense]|nr:hypothetical protein CI41S_48470 [Bradyrhizobium ivorense]